MVDAWEYVEPSAPGRAVIAKAGDKYVGAYFNTLQKPGEPGAEPVTDADKAAIYSTSAAGVYEYTCEMVSEDVARLELRWLYSLYPEQVGMTVVLEVEMDGNQGK